ncbi:SIS domain-containing protein [Anaerolineales bacterium HSG6]|nr:SIS domain-containing protein [Anaerolineales bacterium HSG6]MDM8531119.1 SIS domain-containing protein [Anaerolineales bacterium HSG25]
MTINSHLHKEIHQQPEVLQTLLNNERDVVQQLATAIKERDITHVIIAARGTSDNAARYAKYLLGAVNGMVVTLATPSLFSIYNQPPRFGNALVMGISQSGKSPDIVAVLAEARKQGALTAAISNFADSDLAKQADYVIKLNAGEEKSVAATKTYTTSLTAIAALSASLSDTDEMWENLGQIPSIVETTLGMSSEIIRSTERYRYMEHCVVIGRGYNYATAFELALKLKELTYTIVEPYSSADFQHGPLALIEQGFPVIIVAPTGVVLPEMQSFMRTLTEHGAELITISDDKETLDLSRVPLTLPTNVPEWLSPLVSIIPGQLFAMHLAHTRDYSLDTPRGIRKVTETR